MGSLSCWLLQEATLLSFHTLLPLYLPLQGSCIDEISSLHTHRSNLKSSRRIGFQLANQQGCDSIVNFVVLWCLNVVQTFTVSNAGSFGHKVLVFLQNGEGAPSNCADKGILRKHFEFLVLRNE